MSIGQFLSRDPIVIRLGPGLRPWRGLGRGRERAQDYLLEGIPRKSIFKKTPSPRRRPCPRLSPGAGEEVLAIVFTM